MAITRYFGSSSGGNSASLDWSLSRVGTTTNEAYGLHHRGAMILKEAQLVQADTGSDAPGARLRGRFERYHQQGRLRLKIDPEDGSVIHRDVDLDIDWNEINALEARMLASRS